MRPFERRLATVLSEMPLDVRVAGERDEQGEPWKYSEFDNVWGNQDRGRRYGKHDDRSTSADNPRSKQFKAWSSPKFLDKLSKKVSRLTSHNILLYIGGRVLDRDVLDADDAPERGDPARDQHLRQIASRRMGINPTVLAHSVVVNVTGDNGGIDPPSPWIILHQVAEAMYRECSVQDMVYRAFRRGPTGETFWDSLADYMLKPYFKDPQHDIVRDAYQQLLQFKSAASPGDMDQEIITEYLWHGYVRVCRIENMPAVVTAAVKRKLEWFCEKVLDNCVGKVLDNQRRT